MKKFLAQIFLTKIGWIILSFVFGSVFLGLYRMGYEWALIPHQVFYGIFAGFILLLTFIGLYNTGKDILKK